jgi:SEC-C motif domain protein
LMRSRYSAFALRLETYILETWHPATRPTAIELTPNEEFISLKIIGFEADGDDAKVEFVARSLISGRSHALHEISQFERRDGLWLYLKGLILQR